MRISDAASPLAVAMLLAACGQAPNETFGADAERIDCRIGAATAFDRACTVERTTGTDGLTLTVRHPDGGFRRLLVTRDGRGVATADGAEEAAVSIEGSDTVLVSVDEDSYRLPATMKPGGSR